MKSGIKSEVYDKLAGIAGNVSNSEIENWQKQGGKIVGYFCPFIPEEIIIAGGFLPYKVRGTGSSDTSEADEYFDTKNCSFVRHCFNHALLGKFDFLDAMIVGTGCDHTRRIFDNWQVAPLKTKLVYLLDHPRTMGTEGMEETIISYYRAQLAKMKEYLENNFGVEITVPKLRNAIKLCNETRLFQKKLYELRKVENPPITAAEMASVLMAGASIPKEQYNEYLKTLLKDLSSVQGVKKDYQARLMIIGPAIEDPLFYSLFEENGGEIVIDDTCFGARYSMKSFIDEEAEDPLHAIAKYNVSDVPFCPKINGSHKNRIEFIDKMMKEYKVDGIIGQGYVACDPWGSSFGMLSAHMKDAGIPYLRLEREYISTETGQLSTRIQAFIETIGGRK
ncbi:MAG: 2-hydroxyacyl-CoA dehydratase family protein [Ignavibacteriae bacterium]|nr:2-hydroxyacyl-CoA dehydratase family protein [Ignavibacteriota bacterium]